MSEHSWVAENLGDFVAGSLSAEEAERVDRHLAECAECSASLDQWRRLDTKLTELFADVGPPPGLQDRVIQGVRSRPQRRPLRWLRVAAGIAAAILLGVLGFGIQHFIGDRIELPGNGTWDKLFARQPEENSPTKGREKVYAVGYVDSSSSESAPEQKSVKAIDGEGRGRKDTTLYHPKGTSEGWDSFATLGSTSLSLEKTDGTGMKANDGKSSTHEGLTEKSTIHGLRLSLKGASARTPHQDLWQEFNSFGFRTEVKGKTHTEGDSKQGGKLLADLDAERAKTDLSRKLGGSEDLAQRLKEDDGKLGNYSPPEKAGKLAESGKQDLLGLPPLNLPAAEQPKDKKPDPQQQKADDGRKVIRTGEMAFEVVSYDEAISTINKLLGKIKNATVAMTKSDKLPNGKTKGYIVVRVPPEHLDKFLIDLRGVGEFRSGQIGSDDVTKTYTDRQGELRGARTLEERILGIIKEAKGQVKELLEAERELAQVRLRIERLETEIRGYDNQVALSTVTIHLTEKAIEQAAVIVINEKITRSIAVERVAPAQQAVEAAVMELKGRIISANRKEQPDGQFQAEMELQVAFDKADKLAERIDKLGDVTVGYREQTQHTEGGSGLAQDVKIRHADVRFSVKLLSLASLKPRETLVRKISSRDVARDFKKLRDALVKFDSQLRAQFDDPDQLKISAVFKFSAGTQNRAEIDKLLADVGEVLESSSTPVPANEAATNRKVGYEVTLVNFASQPAQEIAFVTIEVGDVDTVLAAVRDMIREKQGVMLENMGPDVDAKTGQMSGFVASKVPLAVKDELLRGIRALGKVKRQVIDRKALVPKSPQSAAGISITIVGGAPIIPSDQGVGAQVRTSLYFAFKFLAVSVISILVGLAFLLPWVIVIWVAVKVIFWFSRRRPV